MFYTGICLAKQNVMSKITVNSIVSRISALTDIGEDTVRGVLTSLIAEATDRIRQGKEVKIKGIGTFLPDGSFVADESLGEEVNAPFSFFEPVELSPDVTDDMLSELDKPCGTTDEPADNQPANEISDADVEESEPETATAPEAEPEPEAATAPKAAIEPSSVKQPIVRPTTEKETDIIKDNTAVGKSDHVELKQRNGVLLPLLCGFIGFVLGAALTYLIIPAGGYESSDAIDVSSSDTVVVHAAASPQISHEDNIEPLSEAAVECLTDTVKSSYYFTTMARRHYGDKVFWVYIYEENAARLGFRHPERILPGTVVTIPQAEKYGIDPDNQESVNAAKAKAYEIYERFN